jgi:outer membrane protein OmpA-like peptidoglycan-associated protein
MALNLNKDGGEKNLTNDGGEKKKFDLTKKPEVQSTQQEETLNSSSTESTPKQSSKLMWIVIAGVVIIGAIWFLASRSSSETSSSVVENSKSDSSTAIAPSTATVQNTDTSLQKAPANSSGNSAVESPKKEVASTNTPLVTAKVSEQATPANKPNNVTNSKPTSDNKLAVVPKSKDKSNTNFSAGSSDVNNISESFVKEIIAFVSKNPSAKVTINGYASSEGDLNVNQKLSQSRAEKVRDYLIKKDVPSGQLEAVGKGIENPIGDNNTLEGRAKNRRTEVIYK